MEKEVKKTYTVKKGDSLNQIAADFGKTYKVIADLNNIKPPYVLKVGQKLKTE